MATDEQLAKPASESVPHSEDSSNNWLIQQLEIKRRTFKERRRRLSTKEKQSLNSSLALLQETNDISSRSRSRRSVRSRARELLEDIFSDLGAEVLLLCTLAISITKLSKLHSNDDLTQDVLRWWSTVQRPEGLTETASQIWKANSIPLIAQCSNGKENLLMFKTRSLISDRKRIIAHR